MKHSFLYNFDAAYLVSMLFVVMIAVIALGYKAGRKKAAKEKEESDHSMLLSALLGLLGLLLAFSFGMSGSRYDKRLQNIVDESNCIGTAVLRADMYPDSQRVEFKKDFEAYLDTRIAYYEAGRDEAKITEIAAKTAVAANKLWKRATQLSSLRLDIVASNQMIPALNSMLDIAASEQASNYATVPDSILILLFVFSIASSFFIGYNHGIKGKADKLLILGFCLLTNIVIYITIDLDRPRRGLINLDDQHAVILQLKNLFQH